MAINNLQDMSLAVATYLRLHPPQESYLISLGNGTYAELEVRKESDNSIVQKPSEAELESHLIIGQLEKETATSNESLTNSIGNLVNSELRKALVDANGDGAKLVAIYNVAKTFTNGQSQIQAVINSFITLEKAEVPTYTIDETTNNGKAKFLKLFIRAVGLWR